MRHSVIIIGMLASLLSSFSFSQDQPSLEVVVASPKGETLSIDQTQTIFVSFNEAIVPLKEVPQDEDSGPMIVEPKIKGKYRWMGTRTLAFIPADTLPFATGFTVRIPADTRSIAGHTLGKEYRWQFETLRPKVAAIVPYSGQRFAELGHSIRIQFNQRMNPEAASKFISLEERIGGAITYPAYTARWPTEDEEKPGEGTRPVRFGHQLPRQYAIVLLPQTSLKKGASYTIRCKRDLLLGDERGADSFSFLQAEPY